MTSKGGYKIKMGTILILKRFFAICILCLGANILVDKFDKDLKLSKNVRRVILFVLYILVAIIVTWAF